MKGHGGWGCKTSLWADLSNPQVSLKNLEMDMAGDSVRTNDETGPARPQTLTTSILSREFETCKATYLDILASIPLPLDNLRMSLADLVQSIGPIKSVHVVSCRLRHAERTSPPRHHIRTNTYKS